MAVGLRAAAGSIAQRLTGLSQTCPKASRVALRRNGPLDPEVGVPLRRVRLQAGKHTVILGADQAFGHLAFFLSR